MKWSATFCWVIFSVIATSSGDCFADGGADRDQAKKIFAEAVSLFKNENYETAVKKFRDAHNLYPTWKLQYNIGQCEMILKHYGRALDGFERYLSGGGDDISEERQDEIQRELSRLRDLTGTLMVDAPKGTRVLVDGDERGVAPVVGGIVLAVGEHNVALVRRGVAEYDEAVMVRGRTDVLVALSGDDKGLNVAAPATEQAVQEWEEEEEDSKGEEMPGELEEESRSKMAGAGWVLAGVGGAALLTGVIVGGVSVSKAGDFEEACPDKECLNESDLDRKEQVDNLSLGADVLYGIGAVVATTGVILLIVNIKKENEESRRAKLALVPTVGPGSGGLMLEGRF